MVDGPITATPKGGAATLTWTVDRDQMVKELYAKVDNANRRVQIVDLNGATVAYIMFHSSVLSTTAAATTAAAASAVTTGAATNATTVAATTAAAAATTAA